MSSDTGDPREVRKRKTKQQTKRLGETEDLRNLLENKAMRDFVWRLLEQCKVYHTTFTGAGPTTFFNEGQRQVGLWLLNEIFDSDIKAYSLMQIENRTNNG